MSLDFDIDGFLADVDTQTAHLADDKVIDKIRKLLAKAEKAGSEEEAGTYNAKAHQLIAKYGVEELIANAAKPAAERAAVLDRWRIVEPPYVIDRGNLLFLVGKAFGVASVYQEFGPTRHFHLIGAEADLLRTEVLYDSLVVQMQRELGWALERNRLQGPQRKVYSRDFMAGYNSRVYYRLTEAEKKAQGEAGQSVALAVIDRTALVDKRMAELHPNKKDEKPGKQRRGPGVIAGLEAGNRARLSGGTDVTGGQSRTALNS